MDSPAAYRGRFAPSPTGCLHLGSLATAMASYLDARAHDGQWLVRIENIDPPRDVEGADREILSTLRLYGLVSDLPVVYQSERSALYDRALAFLVEHQRAYGCCCTRREVAQNALRLGLPDGVYAGTCRCGARRPVSAWRFLTTASPVCFEDRWQGAVEQNVELEAGDFVLRRADGLWAYQLAVVVDDHAQGITDVVRGTDLLDNTPRQILLYRALGYPVPRYLHIPLVLNADGEKLSKHRGAAALSAQDTASVLQWLWETHFGLPALGRLEPCRFWKAAVPLWQERFCRRSVP